jgi:hypothetical protein
MECALWYWSHGSIRYELYDDEESAASGACWMADDGDHGFPAGVQRSDGTYTPLDEWAAYKAEDQRAWDSMMKRVREDQFKPKPATRTIYAPFSDQRVTVLADAPAWLGRREPVGG